MYELLKCITLGDDNEGDSKYETRINLTNWNALFPNFTTKSNNSHIVYA